MVLAKIRCKTFWFLDKLKGSKLKNHLNDISYILENNEFLDSERRRNKIIDDILKHATTTTPYYKKFKELQRIESFPVINKTIIRNNFDAFRSEPYLKEPIFKVSTSGSTGKPFILYQDINKKVRNTADNLYFYTKANFLLGEKLYILEVWENKYQMNTRIESMKRNMVQINVSLFNDSEIKAFIKNLEKDSSIKNIIGIANVFERICRYLDKIESCPLTQIKIKSAIAISESLNEYTKTAMKKYFNVNIVSRYSNEELGIIAQQYPNESKSGFNINWASYHVEILKMDNDNPAEPGEMGRIVITDLFNYCMPVIRYDTGDVSSFEMILSENNTFPKLKIIEGRIMDIIYDTKEKIYSSFLIDYKFFNYFSLIKQYQFVQTAKKEYLIKLIKINEIFNQEKNLIQEFQNDLGEDSIIKIEFVTEIPPLPSGKRQKIFNAHKRKTFQLEPKSA